jgi:hypothetical protein
MDLGNRITQIEDEIKVLKNEVLAVLLDVKENLLTRENPFNSQPKYDNTGPTITINQAAPVQSAPAKPVEPEIPAKIEPTPVLSEAVVEVLPEELPEEAVDYKEAEDTDEEKPEEEEEEDEEEKDEEPEFEIRTPKRSKGNGSGGNGNGNGNGHGNGDQAMVSKQSKAPSSKFIDTILESDNGKQWEEASPNHNGSGRHQDNNTIGDRISLKTLAGLADWVVTNTKELGSEKTQTILDISEMMGHIPPELKQTLEKMIMPETGASVDEKISARVYLRALKNLAILLEKEDASDFVVFHIVSQGLNSLTKN